MGAVMPALDGRGDLATDELLTPEVPKREWLPLILSARGQRLIKHPLTRFVAVAVVLKLLVGPTDTKSVNREHVEIMTGLGRDAVHEHMRELVRLGALVMLRRGRLPAMYSFNAAKFFEKS